MEPNEPTPQALVITDAMVRLKKLHDEAKTDPNAAAKLAAHATETEHKAGADAGYMWAGTMGTPDEIRVITEVAAEYPHRLKMHLIAGLGLTVPGLRDDNFRAGFAEGVARMWSEFQAAYAKK